MLFTMDDRRRRLEDAEDSPAPENKKKTDCWVFISFVVDCNIKLTGVPSLSFITAAVEWSAEVDQVSEDFFQWYS